VRRCGRAGLISTAFAAVSAPPLSEKGSQTSTGSRECRDADAVSDTFNSFLQTLLGVIRCRKGPPPFSAPFCHLTTSP